MIQRPSWDSGSLAAALSKIQARRATIIGVTSDVLFPFDQQQELANSMRDAGLDARLLRLDAINGHDSFLIDHDRFAPVVRDIFSG